MRGQHALGSEVFGRVLYDDEQAEGATADSIQASLGCGVPTAVADFRPGETVLELRRRRGRPDQRPTGRSERQGDRARQTDEMLERARAIAKTAGVENVEFVKGYMEEMPLADASVDVVISNCVINLSVEPKVIAEAARVLRLGGRFAVSDVIAEPIWMSGPARTWPPGPAASPVH